jgi:hypothetical protein
MLVERHHDTSDEGSEATANTVMHQTNHERSFMYGRTLNDCASRYHLHILFHVVICQEPREIYIEQCTCCTKRRQAEDNLLDREFLLARDRLVRCFRPLCLTHRAVEVARLLPKVLNRWVVRTASGSALAHALIRCSRGRAKLRWREPRGAGKYSQPRPGEV